jgi:hypothetical protein
MQSSEQKSPTKPMQQLLDKVNSNLKELNK